MTSGTRHTFAPFSNGGSKPLFLDRKEKKGNSSDERSQLIDLFQTYADMYPNPRLIEEYRLRDTLLQAATAASVASGKEKKRSERKRGFFSGWWFGDNNAPKNDDDESPSDWNGNVPNEDPLVYLDANDDAEDEFLCGTMHGLDLDCIPTEVYSLARFHLASTRTRQDAANVFREGVSFSSSTQSLVVVGLGEIAELSTRQEPCLSTTSDRDLLLAYSEKENFVLAYVRATVVSDNCIAVSWGFLDGIITIYRRLKNADASLRWEAVWILGPSNGVLENIRGREFFDDDDDHPGSELLRVSDCLPLHLETGHEAAPTVVTLAVARLGGYIELIPLPLSVWQGPALEQGNKNTAKFGSRRTITHYTSGHKIQSPSNTLALTTAQCHIDVLSLQALRTTVDANSTWDVDTFPDSPPSEYIICASGMNENGLEVISFWATSIVFSEPQDQRYGISTELHSSLIEAITVETGPDVSLFATPGIMKRWRKPRSVAIRENFNREDARITVSKSLSTFPDRITTISFTSPVVKIEFNVNMNLEHGVWLTAMDWNGGVAILDCSLIGRLASQSVGKEELQNYENAENSASLVNRIASRKQISNILQRSGLWSPKARKLQSTVKVYDISWTENCGSPCLMLLMKLRESVAVVGLSEKLSLQFATLTTEGGSFKLLGTDELSLITKKNGKKRNAIRHFALQEVQLEGTEFTAKAVDSLKVLKSTQASRAVDTLETCHDPSIVVPEVLSIIRDGCRKTTTIETLRIICRRAVFAGRHAKVLEDQVQEIASFLVKLGTFQLLCQHVSGVLSLDRFREKFQNASLSSMAEGFAERADISALTIIVYRHRFSSDQYMKILDKIPLSTDPTSFAHLVPIFREGSIAPSFLFLDDEEKIVDANWSHMPRFAHHTFGIQLVFDSDDGEDALAVFLDQDVERGLTERFRLWLRARAKLIHTFIGNVKYAMLLCRLGMHSETREKEEQAEELTENFQSHLRYSTLLSFAIEVGEFMVDSDVNANETGIDDLISMKEQAIVEIALKGGNDTAEIVDKCFRFLKPLAVGMGHGEIANLDLDRAISSFCIGLVENCCASPLKKTGTELWFQVFLSSTSICLGIAEESRTTKPRESRIITQKKELLRMVKSILLVSAFTLHDLNISQHSCKLFLNTFWRFCETLPAPEPVSFPANDVGEYFADVLFCTNALIGFEILSQWPGCTSISFLAQFCRLQHANAEEFGMPFMIQMFWSFCGQVEGRLPHRALSELMDDLLEDVTKINTFCFQGSIDVPLVLTKHLIPRLLQMEAFDVVNILLDRHLKSIDCVGVELEMLKSIEDATLVEGDASARKIEWFRNNANALKITFPDLVQVLDPLDRCIKASNFINSSIFKGSGDIEPMVLTTLKHVLPLDIIDCILEVVPECVTYNCPQWQRILQDGKQETTTHAESDGVVQVGDAILYLAAILGCTDDCTKAAVKSKVIQVSLLEGYREEAVMLCQSMILEWKRKVTNEFVAVGGICNAIHLISMESSMNTLAIRKLYQDFLREIYCSVRIPFSSSILNVLTQSASLDFQYICFSSAQWRESSRAQELFLSPDRTLLLDHQPRLKMIFLAFHRLISAGKMQDSATLSLCTELMDKLSSSKTRDGFRERCSPVPLLFFICNLILHISGSAQLTALLRDLIGTLNVPSHHDSKDGKVAGSSSVPKTQLVHSLTRQGYSKCAAARASIMSGNRGNQAAQEWALGHMSQMKSNQPFLNIGSSRKAGNGDDSIHRLRKVLKVIESQSIGEFGAAEGGFMELLHFQNPQSRTTTEIQSRPHNPIGKRPSDETMIGTRNSGNMHQIKFDGAKGHAQDKCRRKIPKTSRHLSQNPRMIQVEPSGGQQTARLGTTSSDQRVLTSQMQEARQQYGVAGSTRGRLIEEGRLLLQKTKRKKRSGLPSIPRAVQ